MRSVPSLAQALATLTAPSGSMSTKEPTGAIMIGTLSLWPRKRCGINTANVAPDTLAEGQTVEPVPVAPERHFRFCGAIDEVHIAGSTASRAASSIS